MEIFIKGDVVVVPFPFSDLSSTKRRPALVVADLPGNDLILCQITSKTVNDKYAINLRENDLVSGSLKIESNIRPNKLFTADRNIILYKLGKLNATKLINVTNQIKDLFDD